jgi:micrococcal nuclease
VRRLLVVLIGSAALLTSACLSVAASPDLEPATVVSVVDGDTIWVELSGQREKIRYIGVDAPETNHPIKGVQEYGSEAKAANRKLVEGRTVRLEFDVPGRDRYGRLLTYVYLEDGTFVNAWLVEHGFAQIMTVPPNVKYQDVFLKLRRESREAQRGLWGR